MMSQEEVKTQCEKIASNLNDVFAQAKSQLETADARAKMAESMVTKVKEATAEEIKRAYNMGLEDGKKLHSTTSSSATENSGGTDKDKENEFKLVLEN